MINYLKKGARTAGEASVNEWIKWLELIVIPLVASAFWVHYKIITHSSNIKTMKEEIKDIRDTLATKEGLNSLEKLFHAELHGITKVVDQANKIWIEISRDISESRVELLDKHVPREKKLFETNIELLEDNKKLRDQVKDLMNKLSAKK